MALPVGLKPEDFALPPATKFDPLYLVIPIAIIGAVILYRVAFKV